MAYVLPCDGVRTAVTIEVRWGAASHEGNTRALNEDAMLASPPVFAVADGMGGHAAGEVASAMAVAELGRFQGASALGPDSVLVALRDANAEIHRQALEQDGLGGMGTTIVGIALTRDGVDDGMVAFNVGDSRLYRWRQGHLSQLTDDHSLVAEMLRAGEVTESEARVHPQRNVVTRALGIDTVVDIDNWALHPESGDRYLLCSDGLVAEVDDTGIAAAVRLGHSAQELADELVALVLTGRASDNVSIVIVDVVDIVCAGLDGHAETQGADEDTNERRRRMTELTDPGEEARTESVPGIRAETADELAGLITAAPGTLGHRGAGRR